jgi:hypothetical protein
MGQTIHHDTFDSELSPVKALARRVHHILSNGGSAENYICEYINEKDDTFIDVKRDDLIKSILFRSQC